MNVLYAQIEKGEKYDDGLLLIPCDVEYDRKIVDIVEPENLLELESDERKRVGVIALSGIENARDSVDVAEIQLVILVLRASGGQDNDVLRQLLRELGVILRKPVRAQSLRRSFRSQFRSARGTSLPAR